ncbi:MAG TPA: hypothetical protein VNU66_05885 [Mycobacteriales bacterium]|nr:hypothetical protein [Mycobacteriales bacterium]
MLLLPAVCTAESGALEASSGTSRRDDVSETATPTRPWLTTKKPTMPATAPPMPPPAAEATVVPTAVAAPNWAVL